MANVVIKTEKLNKIFKVGEQDVHILKDVTISIEEKDFCVIVGPSGCGKSTFLHTILGLEAPTSGEVSFLGFNFYDGKSDDEITDFRKKNIGMVYQQPNWVKSLTVIENVAFPLLLLGMEKDKAVEKGTSYLKLMGMEDWASYIPTELSSGQQQKIALSRALAVEPKVIIADEPTGNLDYQSGQELMELLGDLNSKGITILMVTHDLDYLKHAKTAIKMFDGTIEGIYKDKKQFAKISESRTKRANGNFSLEEKNKKTKISTKTKENEKNN